MSSEEFDVTVIGSGPGGYVAAIRAAQMGLKVACVERDPLGTGGTCLLRGCIPTKALLHTADLYDDLKHGREYGIVADNIGIDFTALMGRKQRIVTRLSKGIESYLFKKNKITLFKGQGRLEGPRAVVVKAADGTETKVATKNVILATGSRPRTLPGLTPDGTAILTSDEILELKQAPKSLIVIGAGAVGIEFASVFARFGATTTVIELLPRVLPLEDEEISAEAGKLLGKYMTIHTSARTEGALKTAHGVEVAFRNQAGEAKSVTAELLLVAVGRGPVTDGLNLESTKVQLEKGYVRTNASLATDEPGIFAIGDVVTIDGKPHPQLAHVASFEGIGVAERLAGKKTEPVNYDRVPSATYCQPEVAGVGLTEAEAKKRGYDVKVGKFNFGNLAKPRIIGHDGGFVKVVSEAKYDEVLGVHMIGPHATDLIAEACVALQLEATTEAISRTMHPHPTLSETLMQAAEAVYGHAIDA
ncbi:MAG TPA: dihydrolipoyl dehydrogenase [Vicinamibacteria bacterium]|nr:dihydrolipoyl dehydrogenase [Vicinamibacteria bacterium]